MVAVLGHFMSHKAVLEGEYWVLYIGDIRIGPVEKATPEELSCWDPNLPDERDHSREVKA